MGAPEIFLEHKKGEKVQKYLRVQPKGELFVIGSSPKADLRILGDGVSGCHAALTYRAPHWYVCDLSGEGNTLIDNKSLSEAQVDGSLVVQIGSHKIKLFAKDKSGEDLFKESAIAGSVKLHQVVVRSRNKIVETHLLSAFEPFRFTNGTEKMTLKSPPDGKWLITELGSRVIQQRLVPAQEMIASEGMSFDRAMTKPLGLAVVTLVILLSLLGLISHLAPTNPEKALDQKSVDIIFNAKAIKKKRIEATKVAQSAKILHGGTSDSAQANQPRQAMPDEATAPKIVSKTAQALTSLRKSGLSQLIGKIAKRASKTGILISSVGVTPDNAAAGRALFSHGTTTTGGGGGASHEGKTYKLGGVGTKGKGGGATNFGDGTALAGGAVGHGEIALIDEETVVEGGLDRDVIAEVIRRNIGQIRYCYERQLSSNPDLYGKIMVKFQIGADGGVGDPKIDSTTMKSAMVEGCVLRRLASWHFPLPRGGTTVKVSYPFLFKAFN